MPIDSDDARKAVYEELKKFDDEMRKNKEHNDLLDANEAQKGARKVKRDEAAETTRHKRAGKSTKARDEFIQKHREFKAGSLKAYDNFVAAMMEIATLVQAWSKSIDADVSGLLTGPMKDFVTANLYDMGAALITAASDVAKHRELAAVLTKKPTEMVEVTSTGDLNFKLFKNDPDVAAEIAQAAAEGRKVPEDFLENADNANRAAMVFLVRSAGYEFDRDQGGFKHEDTGIELKQDDLARIVKSADFEALIGDAMENCLSEESRATPGP
ncbi:MAG: hypothetical protein P1U36_10585 [Legionellaceae bacterium]|nr:hypothetical protein [Legionellaceae bacterium]